MRSFISRIGILSTAALMLAGQAFATDTSVDPVAQGDEEDDGDDELDDILGGDDGAQESVREEQEAIRSGDIDDRVGVQSEALLAEDEAAKRRLIQTVQPKSFLKLGRFEMSPHLAYVTNDPFLKRYIVGANLGYHITEIFAVEATFAYSPILGEADYKQVTKQLVNENNVSPDISRLTAIAAGTFQFSPIYGKVALSGKNIINFDVYGAFGMGVTRTVDDLDALQADPKDPIYAATAVQWQPTTNFGGGARVIFNDWFAIRVDGRSMVYIETVGSTTLEMKNNFLFSAGASFFFPGMD